MFAVDASGSSAAFKKYFRFECPCLQGMGFEKPNRQEWYVLNSPDPICINLKLIHKLPINPVARQLLPEEFQ